MKSVVTQRLICLFVIAFFTHLEVEAVRPIRCPTNKIAPHRRINSSQGRTFGYFFQLFNDESQIANGNLQEQPQADEPDDCGEIEDYDENDISSLNTSTSQRKTGDRDERFFGWFHGVNTHRPSFFPGQQHTSSPPPTQPPRPPRPRPSTRPPYSSGGMFANNPYRPQVQEQPSEAVKPVQETGFDSTQSWRPDVVGGALGQIVGVPVRPARPLPITADEALESQSNRLPPPRRHPTEQYLEPSKYPMTVMAATRRPRQRPLYNNNEGVFGSFFNLFF